MEWIIENKDWFFSGIGIAIPLAVIGWFASGQGNRQVQKSGDNSINIQIGGRGQVGGDKDDK